MSDAWGEVFLNDLAASNERAKAKGVSPAVVFELACNLGQAQPFLAGSKLDGTTLSLEASLPVLKHIRELTSSLLRRTAEMARGWRFADFADIESLSEQSQNLLHAVHRLNCAWAALAVSALDSESAVFDDAFKQASDRMEQLGAALQGPEARPILAAAWEFLDDLRSRFPPDAELHEWWYLRPDGPARQAFEAEHQEAQMAPMQVLTVLADLRHKKTTIKERGAIIPIPKWPHRATIAASAPKEYDKPSSAIKELLLVQPRKAPTRFTVGEQLYHVTRRLFDDWTLVIDIDAASPSAPTPVIRRVLLDDQELTPVKGHSRWVFVIEPPRTLARLEKLAAARLTVAFATGEVASQ